MKEVIVYSTKVCPFCVRAKNWFIDNGYVYREIILETQEAIEQYKAHCPGKKTVPQIVIGDELIGGWDDLIQHQEHVKRLLAA